MDWPMPTALLAAASTWLVIAAAIAVIAVLAVRWALLFRSAMRRPNNGNEFSQDTIGGG